MAMILLSILGCSQSNDSTNENDETQVAENTDAELKIAITSQPTTLDVHTTGDALTRDVAIHIYETLITLNADYQPVPMLAESVEKSEDGKTYTFKLREGVQFHNGKEMKAEDVLASMNRWKERSTIAQEHLHDAAFEAQDDYTVVLQLQNPRLDLLDLLAGQDFFPAIMPKEIIEDAGDDFVKEYVGTGPFQFVDWLQDQYVHLARFDDYTFDDSPADGLAGKKEALVKDLYFYKTQDPSTLLTGLQTGEFDIAYSIAFDHYDQVKNDPNFNVYSAYFGTMNLVYNKKEGLFSDVKMRQAVNAALMHRILC